MRLGVARRDRKEYTALSRRGPFGTNEVMRVAIALTAVVLAYYLQDTPVARDIRHQVYDLRVRLLAAQHVVPSEIVLVAIDEHSLKSLEPAVGRWPWPRAVLASVLDYCSQAKVIALDILFPEGDWQYRASDDEFVAAVRECGNIVNAVHLNDVSRAGPISPKLAAFALSEDPSDTWNSPRVYTGVLAPFGELLEASAGLGHVNALCDEDGVVRTHIPAARAAGRVFPSLALAAAIRALDLSCGDVKLERGCIRLGTQTVPVDQEGCFGLHPSKWEYKRYRIADVIRAWQAEGRGEQPAIGRDAFRGKIVLIGSLATGLQADRKVTSLSTGTGGVEIIAAALQNMLHGSYVRDGSRSGLVIIAILALIPASRLFSKPHTMLVAGLSIAVLYVVLCLAALFSLDLMLPLVGPLLGLVLSSALVAGVLWYEEGSRRQYAEKLEEAKQTLTDMVVHDLRNALAPVVMALEMAESGEDAEFLRESFLPVVRDSSDALLCEINAMLDIRRMQEGRLVPEKTRFEIAPLFKGLVRDFEPAALRAHKCLVLAEADEGAPTTIEADPELMERVLRNLLWNAVKYASENTEIQVGFRRQADGRNLDLFVSNHCEVVPPDMQERLFEPFAVGDSPSMRPRMFRSVGLGLAFCKLAAEAHGGSVRMVSPWPGREKGVEVIVTLPL